VAEEALRSLNGTAYGELSPAWEEEIQRRLRAVEDGSAVTTEIPHFCEGDTARK
jgi:hypothetical protein